MKITVEQYDRKSTVEVGNDDLTIDDVLDDLVIPALVGVGFTEDMIEDAMGEKGECCCQDDGEITCEFCGNSLEKCECDY